MSRGDEDAFLRAILAAPADVGLRLVYADWLEERADADSRCRAEYIRVECELDGLSAEDSHRRRLQERLRQLRQTIGDDWWQTLDSAGVEYCAEFEFRCTERWDRLAPTAEPNARYCSECQRNVYYCRSVAEAHRRADAGECVAIDSRRARLPFRQVRAATAGTGRLLGRLAPHTPHRIPLPLRGARAEPG